MTHAEILKEIDASRRAISRDYVGLRHSLDLKTRAEQSITSRPFPWLGGAAALGWLFAGRKRKRRKTLPASGNKAVVEKESAKSLGILGVLIAAVRILLPFIRPAVTAYAAKRFADVAGKL